MARGKWREGTQREWTVWQSNDGVFIGHNIEGNGNQDCLLGKITIKKLLNSESTNLPFSHRHRKLPAEMNREIYLCFNLATRRKFIWGLGWNFYDMFRQILLIKVF
jgi:hypothetical protein